MSMHRPTNRLRQTWGLAIPWALALGLVTPIGVADTPPSPEAPLVFPAPPDTARIQYIRSISGSGEFAPNKGLLKKVWGAITGGDEPARLVRPHGVKATSDLVLVCDPGAGCVHGFKIRDPDYFRIPKEGRLPTPIDAALDPEGNIYVTDSKLAVVNSYDPDGRLRHQFEGVFLRPTGIVYHTARERIYIVDTMAHHVFVYTPGGEREGSFGARGTAEGQFNFPTAIAVSEDGDLYVTDAMNFRVQVFGPDGEFRHMFGRVGDGTGDFSKPKGVATDSDGNVYVVDALFDAVQIFDPLGILLLSFGRSGQSPGEFWLPAGIDIDEKDRIYVADSYNNRIQVFQYLKN
jgi:DNA-binding beta-propeller fold protein YncE